MGVGKTGVGETGVGEWEYAFSTCLKNVACFTIFQNLYKTELNNQANLSLIVSVILPTI